MSNPFIVTHDSVTIDLDGRLTTIRRGSPSFQPVLDAIREGRWSEIPDLVQPAKAVTKYTEGAISVTEDGRVMHGEVELHGVLIDYMLGMMQQGFDIRNLVKFADNLQKNLSYRVREQLFGFLQSSQLPITSDGHFLAYKKVRDNYTDCYTGRIDNSVGAVVEMDRPKVDDDPNRTCSSGLHVAAFDYAKNFQTGRMMKIKINPADVVSVPTDYNNQKMRVCRYVVVDELHSENDDLTGKFYVSDYDSHDDDDDYSDMVSEAQAAYEDGYEDGARDYEAGDDNLMDSEINDLSDYDPAYVAGYQAGYYADR